MAPNEVFIVHFDVRREGDHFYAKCDEIPGLYVGGYSREETLTSAVQSAKVLMKANQGVDVQVLPAFTTANEADEHGETFLVQLAAA